jgi:hypothetical protein
MELAFATLHHLCAPVLDRLDGLPGPSAMRWRRHSDWAPARCRTRFFVGLAVLGLLSRAAEVRPLLCVID